MTGNLLHDGTQTYTYDALNRLTQRGATQYRYDGDGTLVAATTSGSTISYTQDLAAPLSQILQVIQNGAPITYLYGLERLAAWYGSDSIWYAADALGSVRLTLDDGGGVLGGISYDPWGQVETGSVPTFGFTGELQDSPSGMVYLRARWYNPQQGRFGARDPFQGDPEQPYSQHPYQYGLSDPVLMTDPTGKCVEGTRNNPVDTCNKAYQVAMGVVGLDSELHQYLYTKLDTAAFTELYNWGQAGLRLSNASYWHAGVIQATLQALRRIQKAVGGSQGTVRRMLFAQPLLFSYTPRQGDGATYAKLTIPTVYTVPIVNESFTTLSYAGRIDMSLGNNEDVIVHELGHRFDHAAGGFGKDYWSSSRDGVRSAWMRAAGWFIDCVPGPGPGLTAYYLTAEGAKGAVSEYAVTGEANVVGMRPKFYQKGQSDLHMNGESIQSQAEYAGFARTSLKGGSPEEDFAETFAWYVFNQTGGEYGLAAGVANSRNERGGAPDKARRDELVDLLERFR